MLRQEALREILAHSLMVRREPSVGIRFSRPDSEESLHGDEIDEANWHSEAETNAQLGEIRWSIQAILKDALHRFDLGLYGTCEECGEEIPVERLRIVPLTAYCVDCQQWHESSSGFGGHRMFAL